VQADLEFLRQRVSVAYSFEKCGKVAGVLLINPRGRAVFTDTVASSPSVQKPDRHRQTPLAAFAKLSVPNPSDPETLVRRIAGVSPLGERHC
jgi:hypothetical protein